MPEKTLLDYWIILYKRKKYIVLITVISVLTSIFLSKILPPVYESSAVFYVPSSSQSLSYLSPNAVDKLAKDTMMPAPREEASAPFFGLLKSKKIAELVHKEFPRKKLTKLIISDIDFEITEEYMIKIYSRDNDPELAADVANAYIKYFNILLHDTSMKNLESDKSLIKKQISETKENLVRAEDALKRFQEQNNIASIDDEIKNLTTQRGSFENQLELADVLIKENDEKIKSISEQLKIEKALYSNQDFSLTNPLIENLQKKLYEISANISAASVELREKHPNLLMLKQQYEDTENSLKEEVHHFISSQIKPENTMYEQLRKSLINLLIEKNRLIASKKGYSETIKRVTKKLNRLPNINTELDRLNEEVLRYKSRYEQLKLNFEEAEMQIERQAQFVVVVDTAEPPQKPSFPILWFNIIVALFGGIIAGIIYVFFINYIEETKKIRTRKIIKEILLEE